MAKLEADVAASWKLSVDVLKDGITSHNPGLSGSRERWRDVEELGSGGFGIVRREECFEGPPKGTARAVKVLVKNRMGFTKMSNRELIALITFSDPRKPEYQEHFVRCLGWYEDPLKLYIAMEFIPYGDLQNKDHVQRLHHAESEVAVIITQLSQALQYMHQKSFVHRDLKPQNILVSSPGPNWRVKLADFGVCRMLNNSTMDTRPGTFAYMAPEMLEHAEGGNTDPYTSSIDIWALGAVTFFALTGAPPFPSLRQLSAYAYHDGPFPVEDLGNDATWHCAKFVRTLMDPIGAKRPTIDEVLALPWLAKLNKVSRAAKSHDTRNAWNETAGSWTIIDAHAQASNSGGQAAAAQGARPHSVNPYPSPAESPYSSSHTPSPNPSVPQRHSYFSPAKSPYNLPHRPHSNSTPNWQREAAAHSQYQPNSSASSTGRRPHSQNQAPTPPMSTRSSIRSQPPAASPVSAAKIYDDRSSMYSGSTTLASAPIAHAAPSKAAEQKQKKSSRWSLSGLRKLVGRTEAPKPTLQGSSQASYSLPPPARLQSQQQVRRRQNPKGPGPAPAKKKKTPVIYPPYSSGAPYNTKCGQPYHRWVGLNPYQTCLGCRKWFESRDLMFQHLKYETRDHAVDVNSGRPEYYDNGYWRRR
ncbi:kinase-like domain-containing protein [Xylariales sp. PMI_506]|nr:kinase-like domain-containing protein [Xylariales sp. PMI_506]